MRIDKRDPAKVRAVLDWLFGGGYEPDDPAKFDWRPNVLSGHSLRRQFDRLEVALDAFTGASSEEWTGR